MLPILQFDVVPQARSALLCAVMHRFNPQIVFDQILHWIPSSSVAGVHVFNRPQTVGPSETSTMVESQCIRCSLNNNPLSLTRHSLENTKSRSL